MSIIFRACERGTLLKRGYVGKIELECICTPHRYPSLQGKDSGITDGEITHVVNRMAYLKAVYSQLSSMEAGYYRLWGQG